MSIKTEGAGTYGTLAPFPIGTKVGSDQSGRYDPLLGMVISGPKGRKFRLVKYGAATALAGPYAAGANVAGARLFAVAVGSLAAGTGLFTVQPAVLGGTHPLNRPVGAALKDQEALVQNDYFWLQFDGDYMDLWMGDDGTNVAAGDYLTLDDDADGGCVKLHHATQLLDGGTALIIPALISLSTETGTDALIQAKPLAPMVG